MAAIKVCFAKGPCLVVIYTRQHLQHLFHKLVHPVFVSQDRNKEIVVASYYDPCEGSMGSGHSTRKSCTDVLSNFCRWFPNQVRVVYGAEYDKNNMP